MSYKSEVRKVRVGGWIIDLQQDMDGHLTVGINHDDGSKVNDVGETMLECNDSELVTRYTTEKIEDDYRASMEPPEPDDGLSDVEADAMTLASAGMGTDEDYGRFANDQDY
jgi:hypothetical protein